MSWTPTPYRPSYRVGPSAARLGQVSTSVTNQAAQAIIEQAEPKLRQVISEERARAADVVLETIPYLGISIGSFLISTYVVTERIPKTIGYVLSAGTLGVGLYQTISKLKETVSTAPPSPSTQQPSPLGDILSALIDPATRQMAAAIIAASEPKIEALIEEERNRAANAILSALPWFGVSAAAFLGTMFAVPEKVSVGKLVGYLAAAGSFLFGIYRGVQKEIEVPAPVNP